MTLTEARRLRPGDEVHEKAGGAVVLVTGVRVADTAVGVTYMVEGLRHRKTPVTLKHAEVRK